MTSNESTWRLRVEPRDWQEEAHRLWVESGLRGVASVVTGGGKTIFAQMCMLSFLRHYPSGQFIIVVPTVNLLDQWYISLQEDLGVSSDDIACYSGQEKPDRTRTVNILVVNTARSHAPRISKEADVFLIVDECHRTGSPENAKALRGNHQATLGISATPEREYDLGFVERVVPCLGNIFFRYNYKDAFADKVISSFDLFNVEVEMLPSERTEYDKYTNRAAAEMRRMEKGVGLDEKLKRLLQRRAGVSANATMRIPVAAKLIEQHRGQRALIFHERVEAAREFAPHFDGPKS